MSPGVGYRLCFLYLVVPPRPALTAADKLNCSLCSQMSTLSWLWDHLQACVAGNLGGHSHAIFTTPIFLSKIFQSQTKENSYIVSSMKSDLLYPYRLLGLMGNVASDHSHLEVTVEYVPEQSPSQQPQAWPVGRVSTAFPSPKQNPKGSCLSTSVGSEWEV